MTLPHILWELWKEWNRRIFQEKFMTKDRLVKKIQCMVEENWKTYNRHEETSENQDNGRGEGMIDSHMININNR